MKTTSATGSNARDRRDGFTLIELSIAVFIIAIMIAISAPSFVRSYNASLLDSMGRTLATSCELARLNAVLHQQPVAFYVDMDRQTVWLMQAAPTNDTDSVRSEGQIIKTIVMPGRISLFSAQLGELMPQQHGLVAATFYPNGTCDAFAVTVRGVEKGSGLEVAVDPVTCRGMLWPVKL